MSVRLETLQVARLAPKLLGESADLVAAYIRSELTTEGGFRNRGGETDLYYTVFGLQSLVALRAELPISDVGPYLRHFTSIDSLDLVHLGCLARCWALMPAGERDPALPPAIARRLETYRTADGGYHASGDAEHGTAYHAFLALNAYQDLGLDPPDAGGIARSLDSLRSNDGAYANEPGRERGSTPATAAAVALIRHLALPPPTTVPRWLLARCSGGGFFAAPGAPVPDLLSTATALHALSSLQVPLDPIREACLDFVDSLWTSRGAFFGTWMDDQPDCEYTFYGLLALGHLAV